MCASNFSLFVVGDTPYRARSLASFLEAQGGTAVPAIRLLPHDFSRNADQNLAQIIYGRQLTVGEVGCALAHRHAYSLADNHRPDWALILEDDAEIPDNLLESLSVLPLHGLGKMPTVISLFSTTFVPVKSSRSDSSLVRLLVPPSHTVAYLINRPAWRQALCSPSIVVSSADWPPWAVDVAFYRTELPIAVRHASPSTIFDRECSPSSSRWTRVKHIASGRAFTMGHSYFSNHRQLLKWYAISPVRRLFGRPR